MRLKCKTNLPFQVEEATLTRCFYSVGNLKFTAKASDHVERNDVLKAAGKAACRRGVASGATLVSVDDDSCKVRFSGHILDVKYSDFSFDADGLKQGELSALLGARVADVNQNIKPKAMALCQTGNVDFTCKCDDLKCDFDVQSAKIPLTLASFPVKNGEIGC